MTVTINLAINLHHYNHYMYIHMYDVHVHDFNDP